MSDPDLEPNYPDYTDVIHSRDFHGVAWVPTTILRFVLREVEPDHPPVRVLQQLWETHVMNMRGEDTWLKSNPQQSVWRDIPEVDTEDQPDIFTRYTRSDGP